MPAPNHPLAQFILNHRSPEDLPAAALAAAKDMLVNAAAVGLAGAAQDAGFAHAGFVFARNGGQFNGKCLAAVALPDYPIKEMRTGQHIPGPGDLWSTQLIAAPGPKRKPAQILT